jgi:hypothetical protein
LVVICWVVVLSGRREEGSAVDGVVKTPSKRSESSKTFVYIMFEISKSPCNSLVEFDTQNLSSELKATG